MYCNFEVCELPDCVVGGSYDLHRSGLEGVRVVLTAPRNCSRVVFSL